MSKQKKIIGKQFGKLTIIARSSFKKGRYYLLKCKCSCGKHCYATINELKQGKATDCGCTERMITERGYFWNNKTGLFEAGKYEDGQYKSLGQFIDPAEARQAYWESKLENLILGK